tara:strand:- start:233 stop:415 length:183 start_codon:yes stop_codon:yes gene_type:complete
MKAIGTADLIKLVKARDRLRESNNKRPVHMRRTTDQIDRVTRAALKEGRINDSGVILKKE